MSTEDDGQPKYAEWDTKHPERAVHLDFNEKEESTQIESITYLEPANFKRYVVVPFFGICSAFIFLVCIYNSMPMRKKWLYTESTRRNATHLYIVGKRKSTIN